MVAAGHSSVQMHQRYTNLQDTDVANAFDLQNCNRNCNTKAGSPPQVVDFPYGEGRCPVVPLVFKTSLGAVRSPEGSTPSLLRQKEKDCMIYRVSMRLRRITSPEIPRREISRKRLHEK
jgi:hypothetical protein